MNTKDNCNNFSWVEIYKKIANQLLEKEAKDLIDILKECGDFKPIPIVDKDEKGEKIELETIDYFTFFASFNRGILFENRINQIKKIQEKLNIKEKIPLDFNGIPVVNNQNGWFFAYKKDRGSDDIENLNSLFKQALNYTKETADNSDIGDLFNTCLNIKGVGYSKLTMGMFWINPEQFLPIAGPMEKYLERHYRESFESDGIQWSDIFKNFNWEKYKKFLDFAFKEDFKKLSFEANIGENQIENILLKLPDDDKPKNIILTGIPGTGKTYTIMKYLDDNFDNAQYEFVQFHPSYDYEDFIEGLKPVPSTNGQIEFQLVDGIFKKLCKKAFENKKKTYVMVIDEINRANLSRVFGELLYCLEYRDEFVSTKMTTYIESLDDDKKKEHSIDNKEEIGKFAIPSNVIILGTMNEVDRSIDAFDLALRRRFIWEDIGFNENAFMNYNGFCKNGIEKKKLDLLDKANKLNKKLSEDIGVNYQLGHTYYFKIADYFDGDFDSTLCDLWEYHIKSIVREYCKIKFGENEINSKLAEYKEIIVGKNNCNG